MKQVKLNRLLAGILSLGLILLVIVGPLYLSEKLEQIETASNDIIPTSEIISEENTNISYSPYAELSNNTKSPYQITYYPENTGFYWYIGSTRYNSDTVSWDIINNWDMVSTNHGGASTYLYVVWFLNAEDLLEDGITYISLNIDCSVEYSIHQLQWMGQTSDYSLSSSKLDITGSSWLGNWKGQINTGKSYYHENLTISDIQDGISCQNGYAHKNLFLMIQFPSGYTSGTPFFIDWQFHPDYYQETTTTYNNQTITTYAPYIPTFRPYQVHKLMMGFGALLIFGIGWIASPWGEVLDNVLPINSHSPMISAISGRRKNRRRK